MTSAKRAATARHAAANRLYPRPGGRASSAFPLQNDVVMRVGWTNVAGEMIPLIYSSVRNYSCGARTGDL